MWVTRLRVEGFRGIGSGLFTFTKNCAFVGPNGSGKSTLVDALSLVMGRARMVRSLTEHDFPGSCPKPTDRIRIVATLVGFEGNDPDRHQTWFRHGRGVPKWYSPTKGDISADRRDDDMLCVEIGFSARFDAESLSVETVRFFCDDDSMVDPFDEDAVASFPNSLATDIGFFVLPARRSADWVTSFNSDLFRHTVLNAAAIPAGVLLRQRDQLRAPADPPEGAAELKPLVDSMNQRLSKLLPSAPKFQLRVTACDSESLLQALQPHYEQEASSGERVSLPASRHGTGLLSLQSLLLLLEIGRARKSKGEAFILALEEPELHLAPGLHGRLLAESMQTATQTICTTHAPAVAALHQPTAIFVVDRRLAATVGEPLRDTPLTPTASNQARKLYIQNRAAVVEALMCRTVLIPEGKLDFQWLFRLAMVSQTTEEAGLRVVPPFGTVFGVVPTEDAAVAFTYGALRRLRSDFLILVDGDEDGDVYVRALLRVRDPPDMIVQWPTGQTIEDVICWICDADAEIVDALGTELNRSFVNLEALRTSLKSDQPGGLKRDLLAHDVIAGAIVERPACASRVHTVLDGLVAVALRLESPVYKAATPVGATKIFRFAP